MNLSVSVLTIFWRLPPLVPGRAIYGVLLLPPLLCSPLSECWCSFLFLLLLYPFSQSPPFPTKISPTTGSPAVQPKPLSSLRHLFPAENVPVRQFSNLLIKFDTPKRPFLLSFYLRVDPPFPDYVAFSNRRAPGQLLFMLFERSNVFDASLSTEKNLFEPTPPRTGFLLCLEFCSTSSTPAEGRGLSRGLWPLRVSVRPLPRLGSVLPFLVVTPFLLAVEEFFFFLCVITSLLNDFYFAAELISWKR